MDLLDILTMIGGLALFLYGMRVLGDSLSKASGSRMERILAKLTNGKGKAVLFGAAVTAVIQSSSAATVMVVGLVNSGLLKLSQAVGVIMGANVGTTVTSWILSLSGIESGNFRLRLLKPSFFAPVLAVTGVVILLFSTGEKKKNAARILIGFAILLSGMEAMSGAAGLLAEVPAVKNLFALFSSPVSGLSAGIFLTALLQSSSASIGILQALCAAGEISYKSAVPIIMGQNIGACITALLSSVGASPNAKRAAAVHLYFNLIGAAAFMTLFYGLHTAADFSFMEQPAEAYGIAAVHSIFNLFAVCLLLPFSDGLERLAYLTIQKRGSKAMSVRD
ncbi:MAG: Na/Pi symporter [Bacteroides fragilis]|nr:Na/Pi symporter [Bacteroides fragilis]